MNNFLHKHGWSIVDTFPRDGSVRQYHRVQKQGRTAILMDSVDPDAPGNRVADFVSIGEWLNAAGLKAPEVYEAEGQYLLLEDFGGVSFRAAIEQGQSAEGLYGLAHEALSVLKGQECPLELPNFYDSRVYNGRRFLVEWYLPAIGFAGEQSDVMTAYLSAWKEIERSLPPSVQGFLHIDFHVENLMWLPQEQGVKRCGILDFQGAMIGPKPYDLANLLEDARVDVPEEVRKKILSEYDEEFCAWYRVLATMFHCRLIGQFIKMVAEDGKESYLQYLPRIGRYITAAMQDPVMQPLNAFFNDLKLDFTDTKRLNADEIRAHLSKIKLAS